MSYFTLVFMGMVTCYLLSRVFAGGGPPMEVVVYSATAAFGLNFLIASWNSLWVDSVR